MSGDPKETGVGRKLIALADPYEVRDWCKALGCTKEELETAVKAVGHSSDKVREYLTKKSSR